METEISTTSVERCLLEVSFPASKDKIIKYARKHPEDCPLEIVGTLEKLEKSEFSSDEEVVNEINDEIADEISRDMVDEPEEDEAIESSPDETVEEST